MSQLLPWRLLSLTSWLDYKKLFYGHVPDPLPPVWKGVQTDEIHDVIALWTYMTCSVHMVSCADTGCIHQVWWRSEPQVCSPWSWLAGAGEGGEGGRENGSEGGVVSYKYLLSLATGTASLVSKPYENTRLLQTSRVTCSSTGSAGRVQLHSRRHI